IATTLPEVGTEEADDLLLSLSLSLGWGPERLRFTVSVAGVNPQPNPEHSEGLDSSDGGAQTRIRPDCCSSQATRALFHPPTRSCTPSSRLQILSPAFCTR